MHRSDDPNALFEQDRRDEQGESRWQAVGFAGGVAVLLVAPTMRGVQGNEIIRLISARRATRKERKRYEEETRLARSYRSQTTAGKRKLSQTALKPDSEIDFTDIPELTEIGC